jgi:hypothetical protein
MVFLWFFYGFPLVFLSSQWSHQEILHSVEHDEQLTVAALEPDSSSDGGVKIGAFNGNNMGTSWESIYLFVCLSIYIILYMLHVGKHAGNIMGTSW